MTSDATKSPKTKSTSLKSPTKPNKAVRRYPDLATKISLELWLCLSVEPEYMLKDLELST